MRIYHDTKEDSVEHEELCSLNCKFSWVELLSMRDVRKKLSRRARENNLRNPYVPTDEMIGLNKRLWRYLALLDNKVDVALMRDADARITPRELTALLEWMESEYTFHVMRDHQEHRAAIMAGN